MKYALSFLAVVALAVIAWLGSQIPGMPYLFGVIVPYLAIAVFLGGFVYKIIQWAKVPVPFAIPTTCGQAKSLDFIKHDKMEAPHTTGQVVARMAAEILLFRSLFRNTHSEMHDGPKITYESSKWLWIFALIFHYSFFLIAVRHLRLFLDPVPAWVYWLEFGDGLFQIGAPTLYMTDVGILVGLAFLFVRRLTNAKVRYISLLNDYFPLVLIFGVALTGILMRYFLRTDIDIVNIKQLAVGIVTLQPTIGAEIGAIFYVHLFLVCALMAYFPFSKLMHMGGVFMSPTRNMKNNTREVRHINPWNPRILPHSYEGYEDEFREFMVDAGIPVDKELPPEAPEADEEKE